MRFITLCCLLYFFPPILYGQKIVNIDSNFETKSLEKSEIFYLEDKNNKLSIKDILKSKNQKKFKPSQSSSINLGFSESTYWLKIKLCKKALFSQVYFLELAYPHLDSISFYNQDKNKKWQEILTGDNLSFSKREFKHRNFIFYIFLPENKPRTFYIKVHSRGALLIPLKLHGLSSLRIEQVKTETFYTFFYGAVLIMVIYNLFLFFTLKDYNYLYYSFAMFFNMLAQANMLGHTRYIWGDNIWWSNYSIPFLVFIATAIQTWFGINFLELKRFKIITYRFFIFFIFICLGLAILSLNVLHYSTASKLLALILILFSFSLLIASLISWFNGKKSARFFTLAWFIYLVALIAISLRNIGIFPNNFLTSNGVQIGTILEVLFLSFALADRINFYRRKTAEAQKIALEKTEETAKIIQKQNQVLEKKVNERTQEIALKQQEILTQNEELQQQSKEILEQRDFIKERNQDLEKLNNRMKTNEAVLSKAYIDLKSSKKQLEETNKILEQKDKQVRSSIQVAQTIQNAVLPYQEKLDTLLKDYFIIYKPKDVVSGDFYWLNEINKQKILVTLDCTGHGVPGAFMSLIANTLLDKIIRVWNILNPSQILDKLHEDIKVMLRQESTHNNMGMDANIMIWKKTDETNILLKFAGAKLPMYFFDSTENKIKIVEYVRKSIGGKQNDKLTFTNQTLKLSQNTIIYTGTDGLADQNNEIRKRLGNEKVFSLLEENIDKDLQTQKDLILQMLEAYMQNTKQRDDILWIGFRLH